MYSFIILSVETATDVRQCLLTHTLSNIKGCKADKKCRECEARDCDTDQQCRKGLLCADAHKKELRAAGLDPRKAYCDPKLGLKNWELCYDPKEVGGKTCNNATACSDGNVCNGIEACNVTSGVCEKGPVLDCDDNNLCTTDTCDGITGCIHTPLACGVNKACDRLTGTCEVIENIRPCIAVIDESDSYPDGEIDAKWMSFRTNFPSRPFCLLQPLEPSYSRIYKPTTPDFFERPTSGFCHGESR